MNDIKYLGVQGLEELIILAQNGLAKKADVLQFDVMPDPIKYIGKVVQYVGVSDVSFTRSHFYYSNGIKWTDEQATQIEIVTDLPSWVNADPQTLYILKDTTDKKMGLYVKNPSVNDSWFTVETSGSFAVVDTLPQWADADSSTIYFKADGNILTGYIKKTGTIGAWYTLGGTGSEIIVDSALSATSTNPVQNKVIYAAIQDVLAQVASIYHYKGSCLAADLPMSNNNVGDTWNLEDASSYGPSGTNVAWDGTEWDSLGGDLAPDAVPTDGSQRSVMSGGVYDALLTKENVDNKVTTIDAASTDDQYPSAKAVYDALEGLEPIPEGFVQNVDTGMQPVEDGKVMRISKTAFDALAQRDQNVMYYLDEEHDLIDAKPTCRDVDGNLVKGQKIVELTKAQYDNLAVKDPDTYYMIADDNEAKTWHLRPDWTSAAEVDTSELIRNLHDPDWSQAVSITTTQLIEGYTVPKRGIIVGSIIPNTYDVTGAPIIKINGIVVTYARGSSNEISHGSVQCPVCANDRASLEGISADSCDAHISFVPYKAQ